MKAKADRLKELRELAAGLSLGEVREMLCEWGQINAAGFLYISLVAHFGDEVPDMVVPVTSSRP